MLRQAVIAATVALSGSYGFKIENRDGVAAHGSHDSGHHGHHEPAASASSFAGYEEPAAAFTSGGVTGYGATEPDLPDFTPIVIGILVVTGLSLLFPTYVSLTTSRRKREAGDDYEESGPMNQILERVNDIYLSVVESEECMQRIACEVGGLAGDFGLKERSITKMIDPLVSGKYKTYYKQFTSGQNCQKIKCGSFSF